MSTDEAGGEADLRERMLEMSRGYVLSRAIHVVAELGVANHVAEEPVSAAELARLSGCDAPHLERLLRFLAGHRIFSEDSPGTFVATPLSALLRDDTPGSLRAGLRIVSGAWWSAVGALGDAVRTGEPAFLHCHQQRFFDYLKQHPDDQLRFDAGMANNSRASDRAIAGAYDFSQVRLLIDVGGGRGGLVRAILERYAGVRGLVFDQAQVVAQALAAQVSAPNDRFSAQGGDFFEAVPSGADLYIIKGVLHDFDDERCEHILRNCRQAMSAESKLLIIERLITPDNQPHPAKTIDLLMMALLGGRERAPAEWTGLLQASGLKLGRRLKTASEFTITEAIPG